MSTRKKHLIKFLWLMLPGTIFFFSYQLWGQALIDSIYHERTTPFLNQLIIDKSTHSLNYYSWKGRRAAYFITLILLNLPLIYIIESGLKRIVSDHKIRFRIVLSVFPVLIVAFLIAAKIFNQEIYLKYLANEDALAENISFFAYFLASCFALVIAFSFVKMKKFLYAAMYFFLAAALFFIAGEEISWGQRMFNITTPANLAAINRQGELTLHNIDGVPLHALYLIIGFYGAFSRSLIPTKLKNRIPVFVDLIAPKKYLSFYFLPVLFMYIFYDYLSVLTVNWFGPIAGWGPLAEGYFILPRDQEPAEMILGFGFLFFVLVNRYRQVSLRDNWATLICRDTSTPKAAALKSIN